MVVNILRGSIPKADLHIERQPPKPKDIYTMFYSASYGRVKYTVI
jgi:hypothetical protein